MIHIIKCRPDGSESEPLTYIDPDRLAYIAAFNRQDIVMKRLNDWEEYQRLIREIILLKEVLGLDRQNGEKKKQITGGTVKPD